uniref:Uncharacterized protein n=1 Tax=Arundo donax TaxID=35708 RepID=A0A0A9UI83_ARUDO
MIHTVQVKGKLHHDLNYIANKNSMQS